MLALARVPQSPTTRPAAMADNAVNHERESDAVTDASIGSSPRAGGRITRSGWAVAALFCSMAIFCPVLTLLGPMLGLRALVQISTHPNRFGKGMAWTAVVLGLAATSAWISLAIWWNFNARPLMLHGPREAIHAGYAKDWQGFRQSLSADAAAASDEEIKQFFAQLESRYGPFIDSAQTPDAKSIISPDGGRAVTISYLLRFDRDSVEGLMELQFFREGLTPRIGYIHLRDGASGDLVFPASATDRAMKAMMRLATTQPTTAPVTQP
jgi:hypothetical protein